MKLNRKGYMLVEIVLASVLAMIIAYYLLNLTYKFKNTNEDLYQSMVYMKDKIAITKSIMNDMERGTVRDISIEQEAKTVTFRLAMEDDNIEPRKLVISTTIEGTTITYGKIKDDGNFDTDDVSYYTKTLEKSLMVGTPSINKSDGAFSIIIPLQALYTNQTYDIRILTPEYHYKSFLLSNAEVGSYVDYTGNNGCSDNACKGNTDSCDSSKYSGWRVAYVKDDSAYLISAGAPECVKADLSKNSYSIKTSSNLTEKWIDIGEVYYGTGYSFNENTGKYTLTNTQKIFYPSSAVGYYTCNSISEYTCGTMYKIDSVTSARYQAVVYTYTAQTDFLNQMNQKASTYCDNDYIYGKTCNSNSVWAVNENDFNLINGNSLSLESCNQKNNEIECGYENDLINNGGIYWFANESVPDTIYLWHSVSQYVASRDISYGESYGLRPVIRLDTTVMVMGGTGTEKDPYTISNS